MTRIPCHFCGTEVRHGRRPLWYLRRTTGPRPQPEHPLYLPADLTREKWP